jgi:hypothetical protein
MFRLKKWDDPQTYKPVRFNDVNAAAQDILQVWFAGVHADIGGGYPEKQSGLSKYPLLWMIDEAVKCGLRVNQATVNQLAWGIQRKGSPYSYVAPDVRGDLHTSLSGAWWLLEYLPKRAIYKEWPARQTYFGYYIPAAEPRLSPDGAMIHESAVLRMEAMPSYRPVNLPKQYEKFPMPMPPAHASAEAVEDAYICRVGRAKRAHHSRRAFDGGHAALCPPYRFLAMSRRAAHSLVVAPTLFDLMVRRRAAPSRTM